MDPSPAVARELSRRLEQEGLRSSHRGDGTESFWTSGSTDQVARLTALLWDTDCIVKQMANEWAIAHSG